MRVRFWGTRGSIAKPGPSTARYGGNTSCIEVRSARGTLVIIDCGTGAHSLGQHLISAGAQGLRGHILISHTHWDHIQGIPFFAPLFVRGNHWDIYGPKGLHQSLRETLAGQMQYTYFPVTPEEFGATIHYHDLVEGTFDIDDIRIATRYLNHPALTLGYRLEVDGASLVYCCDHEPHAWTSADGSGNFTGQDLRHAEFVQHADLLIHDAQYTAAEYPSKRGWGHSSAEYAVKLSQLAQVKRLALTHHDPLRDDDGVDRVVAAITTELRQRALALQVFAAVEGETVEVQSSNSAPSERATAYFPATIPVEPALAERSVVLGLDDPGIGAVISGAIRAEGIRFNFVSTVEEAKELVINTRPSLVILEHGGSRLDAMAACRAIRQISGYETPVVMIAAHEDSDAGAVNGVSDWIIRPFTSSYARTKIRAWVLRTECRWIRGPLPIDEDRRIASLHELKILDTDPEERFDRITRLAAALFDVPMAFISLIDENRQWFKSCLGSTAKETPRDVAFCAHVVYGREPIIVPDALQDVRFADNPLVISEPRIRFYAGYPLILEDGSCIGTLCLIDTRPRSIEGQDLERLHDLADIALQEITFVQKTR
jgi:phosphoribosyl 1,2-cyclic phosphodiesterase/DNA-binding response OmpR family regulator